jgi:hypothetical protein
VCQADVSQICRFATLNSFQAAKFFSAGETVGAFPTPRKIFNDRGSFGSCSSKRHEIFGVGRRDKCHPQFTMACHRNPVRGLYNSFDEPIAKAKVAAPEPGTENSIARPIGKGPQHFQKHHPFGGSYARLLVHAQKARRFAC